MSKTKGYVEVTRRNWDADFYADMQRGGHFIISEPAEYTIDGQRKNSLYGAQSPLYGTDFDSEQAFVERYRCKCGEIQGKAFEGFTCPICKEKVTFKDTDIKIIGWISYGKNRLINPYYYHKISSVMPKNTFNDIIYSKYKITTNGIREKAEADDFDTPPLSPYSGIGIDEFYNDFEDIMDYFKKKNKNKASSIDIILNEKNKVFTSHYPVFTPKLRPSGSTSDTYYYNTLDKDINTLFTLSENLKNCIDVERDYIIQRIQQKMVHSWDLVFETLPKKNGYIRGEILGGSLNYTSRNVIVPCPTLHDNEVDLAYNTFLELFKYKIIYYLMKIEDISLAKAYDIWKRGIVFDKKVHDIMQFIVSQGEVKLLINRNPTLNYYSMLMMNIRNVKPTDIDHTMSVYS